MAKLPKDTIYHYESNDGMTMTITMAELVRCKDCVHWEKDEMNYRNGWCEVYEVMKFENGYCDEGKRREDGRG